MIISYFFLQPNRNIYILLLPYIILYDNKKGDEKNE